MPDCIFCGIVSGTVQAGILYQDDDVVAFSDINPQAPVHILVIPRRHIPCLSAVTDRDAAVVAALHRAIAQIAAEKGLVEKGFRVVINEGPDAGQTVGHLHCHILSGRTLAWPPG